MRWDLLQGFLRYFITLAIKPGVLAKLVTDVDTYNYLDFFGFKNVVLLAN